MVDRTVLVPEMVVEKRMVPVTTYREEVRERMVPVRRIVPRVEKRVRVVNYRELVEEVVNIQVPVLKPVLRMVEVPYTVCIPHTEKRQGVRRVARPVVTEEEREYQVLVPQVEKRQGKRLVGQCVPVVRRTTVCEDQGRWELQPVACGGCAPVCGACATACVTSCAPAMRCVWVPNIVQREVEFNAYEWQTTEEPYEYEVTTCRPEVRKCVVKVCRTECVEEPFEYAVTTFTREQRLAQKQVCDWERTFEQRQCIKRSYVPRAREEEYEVTLYDCITEQEKQEYTVCVPEVSQKEIEVQVCRMVERVIQVPVTTCEQVNATCCGGVPASPTWAPAASCCN
jgi:hypothetical protein